MKKRNPWGMFVGGRVFIKWYDDKFDWPYYFVEHTQGSNGALLRGVDYPDGSAKHDGSKVNALWNEVEEISEIASDDSYKEFMGDYGDSPVLRKAVETVDGRDKQEHYGPPEESMRRIGLIWSGILGADISPEKVALMMLGLKAARLSIDPRHVDSLVDAGGYVRILERLAK